MFRPECVLIVFLMILIVIRKGIKFLKFSGLFKERQYGVIFSFYAAFAKLFVFTVRGILLHDCDLLLGCSFRHFFGRVFYIMWLDSDSVVQNFNLRFIRGRTFETTRAKFSFSA